MGDGRFKKGLTPWNKGKSGYKNGPLSEETKLKIGLANKGRKASISTRKLWSLQRKGKKHSPETVEKMRMSAHRGENHYNWKGGYQNKLWSNRQRRIKRLGNGGSHTLGEWDRLKAQYNWTCPSCRKSEPVIKLTVDHIVPVSIGGSDNIENIQPLCLPCNVRKFNKVIKFDL